MDLEWKHGRMAQNMKEIISMGRKMGKELTSGKINQNMSVSGIATEFQAKYPTKKAEIYNFFMINKIFSQF